MTDPGRIEATIQVDALHRGFAAFSALGEHGAVADGFGGRSV